MDARKITKQQILDWLKLGREHSPVYTPATGMINGGYHHWWIEDGELCSFGSGPGWSDQIVETSHDIENTLDTIWRFNRKEIAKTIEERTF